MRTRAVVSGIFLLICAVGLHRRPAEAAEPRILVFSKTTAYRHASIAAGVGMLRELGEAHGFTVDHSEDGALFANHTLAAYAAVVFLPTTGDVLDEGQQAAFERFIRNGGAYIGIHAAADTEYDWPWYGGLVGAYFSNHPEIQPAIIEVEDTHHPSTVMLPARWERTDEWYNHRRNPRREVHVLMTLDEGSYDGGDLGCDHPIAWYREFDGGRSWYTGGGHTERSYAEPLFRQHVAAGILWSLRIKGQ